VNDGPEETCSDCEKIKLEKNLVAAESVKAFTRELEKLAKDQEFQKEKLALEHTNALDSADDTAGIELQKSQWESEFALAKSFHEKMAELAGGSIERSRDSAKYVQTAAAWIATLYTGLLALVFSVTENPLPLRGVYAAAFLGLAVALAAAYLAFISNPGKTPIYKGGASLAEQQLNRTGFLIKWVNDSVRDRRWAIRASVVCLALGVAFIPAAFVAHSHPVKPPEAPAAPAIPTGISPEVSAAAVKLFDAQIKGYEAAVAARNKAIRESSTQTASVSDDEQTTNTVALVLFIVGLVVALAGPWLYGKAFDEDTTETAN
jgi:hypothetical protein